MDTFGTRLRYARLQQKLTQKALADASGLSQSAIGNYESGQRSSNRSLLRLARALNVSPVWLETGQTEAAQGYPGQTSLNDTPLPAFWPFASVSYQDYLMLDRRDRQMLDSLVDTFIRHCLASDPRLKYVNKSGI